MHAEGGGGVQDDAVCLGPFKVSAKVSSWQLCKYFHRFAAYV